MQSHMKAAGMLREIMFQTISLDKGPDKQKCQPDNVFWPLSINLLFCVSYGIWQSKALTITKTLAQSDAVILMTQFIQAAINIHSHSTKRWGCSSFPWALADKRKRI